MAENHRFIVAQFLTLVINNDDEAVVLILQGDPQMGIEQREAVLKILAQGSIFGRIDFIEGDVIKGNILIEQGRNGVDDVRDATAIDNGIDKGSANIFGQTNCRGLHVNQLFENGVDDVGNRTVDRHTDDWKCHFVGSSDDLIAQLWQISAQL